jgi:hypothetical protein
VYSRLAKLGDPLADVNTLFDKERSRSIRDGLYDSKTEMDGHPNIDCVLMIKILVLQTASFRGNKRSARYR